MEHICGSNVTKFPLRGSGYRDEGRSMKRINQYDFYELGHILHSLNELPGQLEALDVVIVLNDALKALNGLSDGKLLQLRICGPEVSALKRAIYDVIETHFKEANDKSKWTFPDKKDISQWWFGSVKNALQKLEHNLSAELRETATYYVERIGGFDTSILVDAADQHLLSLSQGKNMSDIAKYDYRSAGRCLAMQLPTASGFHVMRATEAVLGTYHAKFGLTPTKDDMTMNDYLKDLEALAGDKKKKTVPKPNKDTLAVLREAKDLDRNPLMHPRKTLTINDAHRLFNMASGAIMALLSEMQAIDDAPVVADLFEGGDDGVKAAE